MVIILAGSSARADGAPAAFTHGLPDIRLRRLQRRTIDDDLVTSGILSCLERSTAMMPAFWRAELAVISWRFGAREQHDARRRRRTTEMTVLPV